MTEAEQIICQLVSALRGLSPWKLQDCWCAESDRGGKRNPHSRECARARRIVAAVARLQAAGRKADCR